MNHIVKIHCWDEISGQNRSKLAILLLSFFHHFRGSFWVPPETFQKFCNINQIVKIYRWAKISAQNKMQFSFTFGFRVNFVIFHISGGLFWGSPEA